MHQRRRRFFCRCLHYHCSRGPPPPRANNVRALRRDLAVGGRRHLFDQRRRAPPLARRRAARASLQPSRRPVAKVAHRTLGEDGPALRLASRRLARAAGAFPASSFRLTPDPGSRIPDPDLASSQLDFVDSDLPHVVPGIKSPLRNGSVGNAQRNVVGAGNGGFPTIVPQ
jgi:hypothetical protein